MAGKLSFFWFFLLSFSFTDSLPMGLHPLIRVHPAYATFGRGFGGVLGVWLKRTTNKYCNLDSKGQMWKNNPRLYIENI